MIRRLLLISFILVAQLLDARSVLMEPRPAQVGFAEKVNAYVNSVHNKTSKDGVGQVLSKALFLSPNSAMKSVTAILNELGPHLIRDKSVVEQEACSASLIKILVPIVSQFETALFKGIHTVEHSLEYWQYQELHPASYFFHKSPIKYFTFDQKKEVADKIQVLKKMREQHFELLGKINIHLSTFDAQTAVQDQYAWIQKLCRVLFAYDETLQVADDAEIFPLLYEATNIVSHYKTHMRGWLKKYYMPNIFARRWIELTAGAAAVTGAGWYEFRHPGETKKMATGTLKRTKTAVREIAGLDEASRSGEKEEAGERRDGAPPYEQCLVHFLNMPSEKRKTLGFTTQEIELEIPKIIFSKRYKERRITSDDYEREKGDLLRKYKEAHPGAGELEEISPSHLIHKLSLYYWDSIFTGLTHVGNKGSELGKVLCDEDMTKWNWLTAFRRSLGVFFGSFSNGEFENGEEPFLANGIVGYYNMFSLRNEKWTSENKRTWALIKSSPVTIPLALLCWSGYKVYRKKSHAFACDPVRVALVDIALLLNVYGDASPEEMDASDFGRLAYLAHKLELDSGLVPAQYRESFLIEVGLLRTSSLNAQQKMKVIDLMYKKYPFLAFQGMITA